MTKEQKIIRAKVGLLELAKQLGNVSQACKMMGYSRDSFYRFKELYDAGGELALQELRRRKPILKNRTPPEVEAIIVELSLDRPACGQIRIANELRKLGHSISPAGVRGVWQRLALEDVDHSRTKTKHLWTTDVIDKCFFAGSELFSSRGWVTARRRAGREEQALPRSPRAYGRSRQRRHADRGGRELVGRTHATDPALALPPKPPRRACRAHAHGPAS
jgi:hypothetical protein